MKHRLTHYPLLLFGVILSISLVACVAAPQPVLHPEPDVQWYRTFGDLENNLARSVQQTTDGGYIICGTTGSYYNAEVLLIKTDTDGNKLWDKTFGGKEIATGSWVQQTTDGGYIICVITGSWDKSEVLLMKTDAEGNKLWDKTFGGKEIATGSWVQQTTDGGYIICGMTRSLEPYTVAPLLI